MSSSVRVPVAPRIWDWILDIGTSKRLEDADREKIRQWQSRESDSAPTVKQLTALSNKLHVPFGYFFLNQPIDDTPPVFAHRTIASTGIPKPSRDLVDTLTAMESIQDWLRQDCRETGTAALPFVGSFHVDAADARRLSEDIRRILQLDETWFAPEGKVLPTWEAFTLLREHCMSHGITVMLNGIVGDNTHRPLNPQEFRAFALIDVQAPLIFINRRDSEHGMMFSLAHELAHVWSGSDELYNDDTDGHNNVTALEMLCNATAAELLVPRRIFVARWSQYAAVGVEHNTIMEKMREFFPVSDVVIARCARDEKLIGDAEYQSVVEASRRQWAKREKGTRSGGDYYNTKQSRLDHRFVERLAASVSEGRTTYVDAYRLTGTNYQTFPKLLETVGA